MSIKGKDGKTMTDEQVLAIIEGNAAREAEWQAKLDAKELERVKAVAAAAKPQAEAENCEMELRGSILTIVIDLAHRAGLSASGKTTTVASTHGNRTFLTPDGQKVKVGVNAFAA